MAEGIEVARAFVTIIPTTKGAYNKIKSELGEEIRDAAAEASEQAGEESGEKLGQSLGLKAAAAFTALGLGVLLANAITQGFDMEAATAKLTASFALTEAESERAGQAAGNLYANAYGESAGEAAKAVGAVMSSIAGMRSASSADLEALTAKTMSLASAFDLDVTEAAQAAGQLIESGMAKDGVAAVDLLAATLAKVPQAMRGDIIDAANEYGTYLTNLGLSGEEAMSALVSASAGGTIAIDKTGDALKELSIRATDMSASSVQAYQLAGLNAEEMSAKFLAGGDEAREALAQLVAGLQGIEDPTKRANAAIALFGTPLEDIGVTKIPAFLDGLANMDGSLGQVSGAAARLDTQLNGTTAVSLEAVKRSFVAVVVEGVQPMLAAMKPLLDWLLQHPVVLQAIAIGLGIVAVALGIATVAQWAMNAALLANPITWIILAVVALIAALVLLVSNWDWVAAQAAAIWGGMVAWFAGIWNAIAAATTAAWTALTTWLSGVWTGFVAGVAGIWNSVKTFFVNLWRGITSFAVSVWNAHLNFIRSIPGRVMAGLAALGRLAGAAARWFLGFHRAAIAKLSAAIGWIRSVPGRVMAGLAALGRLAGAAARWFLGFHRAAVSKLTAAIGWIRGVPGRIMAAFGSVGGLLVNAGRSLVNGFLRGIQGAWGRLTGWVSGAMSKLRGLWPFSPAKWGPFSGRGYVTYSGAALTGDFADSLRAGTPEVEAASEDLMRSITLTPAVEDLRLPRADTTLGNGATQPTQTTTVNIDTIELPNIREIEDFVAYLKDLPRLAQQGAW